MKIVNIFTKEVFNQVEGNKFISLANGTLVTNPRIDGFIYKMCLEEGHSVAIDECSVEAIDGLIEPTISYIFDEEVIVHEMGHTSVVEKVFFKLKVLVKIPKEMGTLQWATISDKINNSINKHYMVNGLGKAVEFTAGNFNLNFRGGFIRCK